MTFSASSDIFLLPLSVSLTKSGGDGRSVKFGDSEPPGTALLLTTRNRSHAHSEPGESNIGLRVQANENDSKSAEPFLDRNFSLSLSNFFLADQANSLLRVFDDLTRLDSLTSPIVLYGPTQTGKSLLSAGIAHRIARVREFEQLRNLLPNLPLDARFNEQSLSSIGSGTQARAICLSAADWSRQLQEAIDTNAVTEFRERFLTAGAVQIDDIIQLKNSPCAQSQLVILLDLLLEASVPVFVTSTLHPNQLDDFRVDLVSRLMGGLVLPVNFPGAAAKRAYLLERANHFGICLSTEIYDWLANQAPLPTFAALDGLLQEVAVSCREFGQSPKLSAIKAYFLPFCSSVELSELVIETTADFFQLTAEQLRSPCRRQTTVLARGFALVLLRDLSPLSLNSLGQLFGNRDHSTVLSALQTTEKRLRKDKDLRSKLLALIKNLKTKAHIQKIPLETFKPTKKQFSNHSQSAFDQCK